MRKQHQVTALNPSLKLFYTYCYLRKFLPFLNLSLWYLNKLVALIQSHLQQHEDLDLHGAFFVTKHLWSDVARIQNTSLCESLIAYWTSLNTIGITVFIVLLKFAYLAAFYLRAIHYARKRKNNCQQNLSSVCRFWSLNIFGVFAVGSKFVYVSNLVQKCGIYFFFSILSN